MFDKQYFDEHCIKQAKSVGGGSSIIEIQLNNGRRFRVCRVIEAFLGYVLVEVYPEEVDEDTRNARKRLGGTGEVFWDQVAIPYEGIGYVFHTLAGPDTQRTVGFGEAVALR